MTGRGRSNILGYSVSLILLVLCGGLGVDRGSGRWGGRDAETAC
jgi:hypothetical protein